MSQNEFENNFEASDQRNANPFQSPMAVTTHAPVVDEQDSKPPNPTTVFVKWLVVCGISAAPSFVMAMISTGQTNPLPSVLGMLLGVMMYVVGYTMVEMREDTQRLMRSWRNRMAARIAYGIRIGMSVIFPIAMYVDILAGMASLSITSSLFFSSTSTGGFGGPVPFEGAEAGFVSVFLFHFLTTMVQGLLLNIVVFTLMLMAYAFTMLFPDRTSG